MKSETKEEKYYRNKNVSAEEMSDWRCPSDNSILIIKNNYEDEGYYFCLWKCPKCSVELVELLGEAN